jgi:hypothetical protein
MKIRIPFQRKNLLKLHHMKYLLLQRDLSDV